MTGPLRNPSFRRVWLADLLSSLGSQVSRMALILYLFQRLDSVAGLALLVALETLPGVLAAPAAGVLADRASKRAVMVAADLARAVLLLAVLLDPSPAVIYAVAALHSVATVAFQPAQASAVPLILPPGELPRANGLAQVTANLVLIGGPLIGAELFLATGLTTTLLLDAGSFVLSALLLAGTRIRSADHGPAAAVALESAAPRLRVQVLGDVREGWRYAAGHGLVRPLVLLFFVSLSCVGLWLPIAPFFIREFLGGSERILALQLAVFGAGGALGGLAAPAIVARLGQGGTLLGALLAEAALMTVYSAVSRVAVSVGIIFVWGIVVAVAVVPFYSILQTVVEERFLGRVFSLLKQSENLALVLAMGLAVVLRGALSSHWIFTAAGVAYLAVVTAVTMAPSGRALRAVR